MASDGIDLSAEVSAGVSADGAKVSAGFAGSAGRWFFSAVGSAVAFVVPEWAAKAELFQAVSASATAKIRANRWEDLNDVERQLLGDSLEIECDKVAQRRELEARIDAILPEVSQLKSLPAPSGSRSSSASFVYQAATISAEIRDHEMRDVFARLASARTLAYSLSWEKHSPSLATRG
jgi:hypothetical protein